MGRRNEHSREELREMALRAAERIVREEGFAAFSARKLAAEIGYTVGTLYLVFRNLDDLLLQLNARTLDRLHAALAEAASRCPGAGERVHALGHGYVRFARDEPRLWSALYEYSAPENEPLPDWYQQRLGRLFGLVETALAPLALQRPAGELRRAARVLWGAVHGICVLKLLHRMEIAGSDPVEQLVDSLIENYLAGFAGHQPEANA